MPAVSLRLRIHLLGLAALVGYAALTPISYVQAPALWRSEESPQMIAFFEELSVRFPILALYRSFPSPEAIVASYWCPLTLPSLAVLLLTVQLTRGSTPDEANFRLIFNWSLAFAAVCLFAFPVFTQDMWLSAVWGRMIGAGVNPYYNVFSPETLAGLPLDHFPMVMSYGPLWGILAAIVMAGAGSSALATGILFKALLGAAWLASLVLVGRITRTQPMRERCLAVGVFGWTPASVSQTIAEGHNDIVLVLLALIWLHLLLRPHWAAPIALVASALCKYATAPLLLVDAVAALRRQRTPWPRFLARLILPAILGLGTLAIFYRSTAFFDGLKVVSEWQFLRPTDAFIAIENLTGMPMLPLKLAALAFFPVLCAYWLAVAYWSPTAVALKKAAAAIMAAILFSGVSHVWPWYAIWALAFTVVVPRWWLSRFVLGVSIVMPFALAAWWLEPIDKNVELAALITYASAGLWTVLTRERHGYDANVASIPHRSS